MDTEARLVAILCVTSSMKTGLQTVSGPTRSVIGSPCCDERMTRQLQPDSDGGYSTAIAFGRPGIGNEAHPFTCPCGRGYVVIPNPTRSPAERTRILKEVIA